MHHFTAIKAVIKTQSFTIKYFLTFGKKVCGNFYLGNETRYINLDHISVPASTSFNNLFQSLENSIFFHKIVRESNFYFFAEDNFSAKLDFILIISANYFSNEYEIKINLAVQPNFEGTNPSFKKTYLSNTEYKKWNRHLEYSDQQVGAVHSILGNKDVNFSLT